MSERAFPVGRHSASVDELGLTKREYIAIEMMKELVEKIIYCDQHGTAKFTAYVEQYVDKSYALADMIIKKGKE
jgi:hypothetical protein